MAAASKEYAKIISLADDDHVGSAFDRSFDLDGRIAFPISWCAPSRRCRRPSYLLCSIVAGCAARAPALIPPHGAYRTSILFALSLALANLRADALDYWVEWHR